MRNIVKIGDDVLSKKCRVVEVIDSKILTLLDDMADTMYASNGVGLAASQVGVLKRVITIDVGDGLIELINPKIITQSGGVDDLEGCLSVPGKWGYVLRPQTVTVQATNRDGEIFEMTGEDLLARAFCHEIDHLDGHLFVEFVTEFVEREAATDTDDTDDVEEAQCE